LVLLQGLLVLAVFLVYSPSLRNGFVWDDDDYIVNNRHVANGLTIANTVWAVGAVYSANWHPLTWISHMLDCSMYGMKPAGHHLSNIVLHAACTIVLMHVLLSFGLVPFASFAGAALFSEKIIVVHVVCALHFANIRFVCTDAEP
jgi:hypothetical protein